MKCGKVPYATAEAAREDARIIWATIRKGVHVRPAKGKMREYHCKKCGNWHLTKQQQGQQRHNRRVINSNKRKKRAEQQACGILG